MELTLPEAGARFGYSPDYLRVAANRGALRATKRGRDWTVSEEEMKRFLAEGSPEPEPLSVPDEAP